jgi:phage terminase small subunit
MATTEIIVAPKPKNLQHARKVEYERFAREYLVDLNGTAALKRIGYDLPAEKLTQRASQWLAHPYVKKMLAKHQATQLENTGIRAERVLEEMRRIAYFDTKALFDEHGNLRSINDLPSEVSSCIKSFEVIKRNLFAGDGRQDIVYSVKMVDKIAPLMGLAKHLQLLIEKTQQDINVTIRHELPDDSL